MVINDLLNKPFEGSRGAASTEQERSKRRAAYERKIKSIALYDAEVAFTDLQVGLLLHKLKQLGLEEDTLVVITADHGEGLMQHGWMGHGPHIYEEAARVPLIFRWPREIPRKRRFAEPVELTDLVPTVLDLAGIDHSGSSFHGLSLAGVLQGNASLDPKRNVYLYRRHYEDRVALGHWAKGEKFGIRAENWKYIEGFEERTKELFNLAEDPEERRNLVSENPVMATELSDLVNTWVARHRNSKPVQFDLSQEDLLRLRALGYVK